MKAMQAEQKNHKTYNSEVPELLYRDSLGRGRDQTAIQDKPVPLTTPMQGKELHRLGVIGDKRLLKLERWMP